MTRFPMNTLENSRKSLTRMIKAYDKGDMEADKYRNLVYGMNVLLSYWKLENDLEYEKRFEELERRLDEQGKT